jgi:hypothetical protein
MARRAEPAHRRPREHPCVATRRPVARALWRNSAG